MQSDDTSQPTKTALVTLSVPVTLPLALVEQIERGEVKPSELFDVTLAYDASEHHGLASDVFNIDLADVEIDRFGDYDPTPDESDRPVRDRPVTRYRVVRKSES
jgi:hypothetical protein